MSGFNASQQRYITAVLAEVSKHLDSIESLMHARRNAQINQQSSFSNQENASIKDFLASIRVEIRAVIDEFKPQHPAEVATVRWRLRTHLEFADVEFQEISAKKLRGYGTLDEKAYSNLEQTIASLREHLRKILDEIMA